MDYVSRLLNEAILQKDTGERRFYKRVICFNEAPTDYNIYDVSETYDVFLSNWPAVWPVDDQFGMIGDWRPCDDKARD